MEELNLKKTTIAIILAILMILTFLLLKPILMAIIMGIILAFIFSPIYNWLYKSIKLKNISALIVCALFIGILILPIWFLTPIILEQSIKVYQASQQIDFITPLKKIFPSIEFSSELGKNIRVLATNATNALMNRFAQFLLNFPSLFLQFLVTLFTFFFILRDSKELVEYIRSLLPFSKETEKKLFENTKGITSSVLYGQVIIGIIQGILVSIGLLLFGISNALLLSSLAIIAGVLPIIGTTIVWLPVAIYLFMAGDNFAAVGLTIFGIFSNVADNFIRPIIISKRTVINSPLVLIGMIGGLFLFGLLGLILGPLILAYLLIILEVYRNQRTPPFFIKKIK